MQKSQLKVAGISAGITLLLSGIISIGVATSHELFSSAPTAISQSAAQSASGAKETDTSQPESAALAGREAQSGEQTPSPATPTEEPAAEPVDCSKVPCVALTFDDGPDATLTPRILDTLKAKKVKATFFQMGRNIAGNEAILRRAIAEGHTLGTHSWDHPQLPLLTEGDINWQITNTKAVSQQASGVQPTLMRPPYGLFNDTVISLTTNSNDAIIMWDVDTEDWKNLDVQTTTDRALSGAHPGAIILLHDVHPSTADAVPGIIDGLKNAGYTLVDIPTLLGSTNPGEIYYNGLEPQAQ